MLCWTTLLPSIAAVVLAGCSLSNASSPSVDSKTACMDSPNHPWCASASLIKIYCKYESMAKLCPKSCKLCSTDNSTDCDSLKCDHVCSSDENEIPKCECRTGYELQEDGKTCQDINECTKGNPCPGDEYSCMNTEGSYRCEVRCSSNEYQYYKRNKCCQASKGIDESCGINSENGGPEVRGQKGMVTRWPWMTLITIESSSRTCAGILVSSSWVMVAAHCVDEVKASDVKLVFGIVSNNFKSRLNKDIQERVADSIYIHPKFNHPYNDVALIKLNRATEFDDFVRPNCLSRGEDPVIGQNCWALGYAMRHDTGNIWRVLHEEKVTISKTESCNVNSDEKQNSITCISHEKPQVAEDCQGSTGGPLVCQRCSSCGWYVAGFATKGESCAYRRATNSNFTRASDHEIWMRETMGLAGLRSVLEPSCKPPRTLSHWSAWGSWSRCSVTCGDGMSRSRRFCQGVSRGPEGCRGDSTRSKVCQLQTCKLAEKSKPDTSSKYEWGEWSECSSTCGGGTQQRFRCSDRNSVDSEPCRRREKDVQSCNIRPCPMWSKWTEWDQCSVTCGRGKRVSKRTCLNGKSGDRGCFGRSVREKFCRKQNCPDWSAWSSWSDCSVSCGEGQRSSSRRCLINRHRATGCNGNSTRVKLCSSNNCEECTEWTSWSSCSATCGLATQRSTRKCPARSARRTEVSRRCSSRPCPATWAKWSSWSTCSVSCGGGQKSRERSCEGEHPRRCVGSSILRKPCNEFRCPSEQWSRWSTWSSCDVECGAGLRTRERECKQKKCSGPNKEQKMCQKGNCRKNDKCADYNDVWHPLYCRNVRNCWMQEFWLNCPQTCCQQFRKEVYTDWSKWSSCSSTCGDGWQERRRSCLSDRWCHEFYRESLREIRACNSRSCFARDLELLCSASCGGGLRQRPCLKDECTDGETLVTEECNMEPCPVELSEWSEWTDCSVTCGNGTRERTRNCTGQSCKNEVLKAIELCHLRNCNVWSDWKYVGECSVACGLGSISKKRTCLSGSCEGKSEQDELCVGSDCPSVSEYSICDDDPAMMKYCQLLKGNCENGYMSFACRKSCGLCT